QTSIDYMIIRHRIIRRVLSRAHQRGILRGHNDVLLERCGRQVPLLNERIPTRFDSSLVEPDQAARSPHCLRRQRGPADVAGTRPPRDPGGSPNRPRNPVPSAVRNVSPTAVVEGRPAPVVARYPGPSAVCPDPMTVRIRTPAGRNTIRRPHVTITREGVPAS